LTIGLILKTKTALITSHNQLNYKTNKALWAMIKIISSIELKKTLESQGYRTLKIKQNSIN
jgi:hypothetical protein